MDNSPFKRFMLFDILITTWIVRITYWICQILIILFSFLLMFVESDLNRLIKRTDDPNFFLGLAVLVLGSLILRLFTESTIVLFKISENTSQLKLDTVDDMIQLTAFDPSRFTKKCPACKEEIKLEALVCKFCNHEFSEEDISQIISQTKQKFDVERKRREEDEWMRKYDKQW